MHDSVADRWGGIELARRECVDRERWRLFCRYISIKNTASDPMPEAATPKVT